MRVRIQSVTFKYFKNISSGKILFPCNLDSDIFSLKSDVLGIYGPNSSGKSTFIDALKILKYLLSGVPVKEYLRNCITIGHDEAELSFELSVENDHRNKFRTIYAVQIGLDHFNETVKVSTLQNNVWGRMNPVMVNRSTDYKTVITPTRRRNDLFGKSSHILDELRSTKRLCASEHRSFLFSDEVLTLIQTKSDNTLWCPMFAAIRHFAETSLFVIDNQNTHLNSVGTMLPLIFQTGNSIRQLELPLNRPTVIQDKEYVLAEQAVAAINTVLCKMVPAVKIALVSLGTEHTENRNTGIRVQLIALKSGNNETIPLPLKYESAGIKKIISLLPLLICTYNNPGITLAIDELDSNIYEHLLGELLRIMQDSGQGQLIFTSHNLRPLEVLDPSSAIFTTTDPQKRYIRPFNIKSGDNLRLHYFRDITLGGDSEELCQEISSIEIAHAMRKVDCCV